MILILFAFQVQYGDNVYQFNSIPVQDLDYVSLKKLSEKLGCSMLYDSTYRVYTIQKEARITIVPENPFIKYEEKFIQLTYPVIEIDGEPFVPLCELPGILSLLLNSEFRLQGNNVVEVKKLNVLGFNIKVKSDETVATLKYDPSLEILFRGEDTLWVITIFDAIYNLDIFPTDGKGFIKRIIPRPGEGFLELKVITAPDKDVNIKKLDGRLKIEVREYRKKEIRTIVVDPGHGGKDSGAIGNGLKEKDVTLKIAKYLSAELKSMGFHVIMTRTDDTFLSLKERTEIADNARADLFVSIHCNSVRNKSYVAMHGTETYFLSVAKTDWARAVEATENSSIKFEGADVAQTGLKYVLWDLAQSQFLEESQQLAIDIQESIVDYCRTYNRGVNQANFYVLRVNYMPAVLVETLFISNPDDAKKLKDDGFLKRLARGIARGIKKYVESRNG